MQVKNYQQLFSLGSQKIIDIFKDKNNQLRVFFYCLLILSFLFAFILGYFLRYYDSLIFIICGIGILFLSYVLEILSEERLLGISAGFTVHYYLQLWIKIGCFLLILAGLSVNIHATLSQPEVWIFSLFILLGSFLNHSSYLYYYKRFLLVKQIKQDVVFDLNNESDDNPLSIENQFLYYIRYIGQQIESKGEDFISLLDDYILGRILIKTSQTLDKLSLRWYAEENYVSLQTAFGSLNIIRVLALFVILQIPLIGLYIIGSLSLFYWVLPLGLRYIKYSKKEPKIPPTSV